MKEKKGGVPMKKEVMIKITLTDDNITFCDGKNLIDLSYNDIIDIIKMLVRFAKTLGILREGDAPNGNA